MKTIAERAAEYVATRLDEPPKLNEVARAVGVNVRVMREEFKKQFGVSLDVYGRRLRLQRAKELLRETEESLEAIALAVGYCDAPGLCAAFKKEFGMTPGKWRRNF